MNVISIPEENYYSDWNKLMAKCNMGCPDINLLFKRNALKTVLIAACLM